MYNNQVTMTLLTNNGNAITEYNKDGLVFVEGRKGSEYKIKVTNSTNSRVKAIISVDGLDIISGERAHDNSKGYVLEPYASVILDGWRISNEEVRKFIFTTGQKSYNAKTGNDTNNVGVIGLLAFKEVYVRSPIIGYNHLLIGGHYHNPYYTPLYDSWSSEPVTACASAMPMNASYSSNLGAAKGLTRSVPSVGTGMGDKATSKVTEVNYKFETVPFARMAIYYKHRKELLDMGIKVAPTKVMPLPQPFAAGYCKQV